jgi:miniconductance mechanosensitive channel
MGKDRKRRLIHLRFLVNYNFLVRIHLISIIDKYYLNSVILISDPHTENGVAMLEDITIWLTAMGIRTENAVLLSQILVLIGLIIAGFVLQRLINVIIKKGLIQWVERTETLWDDIFYHSQFFFRLASIPPLILLYYSSTWIPDFTEWIQRITLAAVVFVSAFALEAALTAVNDIYDDYEVARSKPIKGYIQVGKLILWAFAAILIVSALRRSSPLLLLGGLGAFSAVLLLVFKDTLLGLFASVQFATNDMVRIGDWIEMPEYDADGEVIDISVHTVKVSNWDKTISTIPTYSLMAHSFKNWRGMELSGGRRIKRALHIDLNTIRFADQAMLQRLSKLGHIQYFLEKKQKETLQKEGAPLTPNQASPNEYATTNLGAFRGYIFGFLQNHPKINPQMEILVRLMAPTENGLPLEIYAFCTDKRWEDYEEVQAEIFDHLLAILPEFGLAAYQNPSGVDIRSIQAA